MNTPNATQVRMQRVINTLRSMKPKRVCGCVAYSFPHRAGGGKCGDPGPEPESCSDCSNSFQLDDPFNTGDSPAMTECGAQHGCPWNVRNL